jgi:hypothetical protein
MTNCVAQRKRRGKGRVWVAAPLQQQSMPFWFDRSINQQKMMEPESAAPSPLGESFPPVAGRIGLIQANDCRLASGARVEVEPVVLSVLFLPTLVHSPFMCTIQHRWQETANH